MSKVERNAAYRAMWLASMVEENRVRLTHDQFRVLRELVLLGMQNISMQEPVNSVKFKEIRDVWGVLAPVAGKDRFVIEVS
jgi:hypothetical protein